MENMKNKYIYLVPLLPNRPFNKEIEKEKVDELSAIHP